MMGSASLDSAVHTRTRANMLP